MASNYCVFMLGFLCIALTVDYVNTQRGHGHGHGGEAEYEGGGGGGGGGGGSHMTTAGPYDPTMTPFATTAAGEVEYEPPEEVITTTVPPSTTTTPPPPKRRRPKKKRGPKKHRRPKPARKTPAPTTTTLRPTTTPKPTTTPAPTTKAPVVDNGRNQHGWQGGRGGAHNQNNYNAHGGYQAGGSNMQVRVVATEAPTTKAPRRNNYMYQPHSCPKMDVATWENEVVIYDNINCAIVIRMNPRLRRPTVTFMQPYW